jgi:DNA-binding PadR family transcriptional regulator
MPTRRAGADPGLLVLVSLAGSPKHGHAILLDIVAFANTRLGPGTLYGAIERLEADRLIEPLEGADDRRRPYRLTDAGHAFLAARLASIAEVARVGLTRVKS